MEQLTCLKKLIHRIKIISGIVLLSTLSAQSQQPVYNYFYRVSFTDKGSINLLTINPATLLSQRALSRRSKAGVPAPDILDIPVRKQYIDSVIARGYTLHCTSRWMNTALFKSIAELDPSALLDLPFVASARIVKKPAGKKITADKFLLNVSSYFQPPYDNPVTMIKGNLLHDSGYDGTGVLVAVLDAGFYNADIISSVASLRDRNGIIATHDFVTLGTDVYSYHNHGTEVLSVLSGLTPGEISGSAPGADYCLFRTEDASSEYPVEEDFWAAGAELADSIGADIISSSLGYFNFDDSSMNYSYSAMNGHTTFVTRAAEAAASKGILVVNSAGNERITAWQRIIAPSDGENVLAVGAVDGTMKISSFSSAGPSADGRVKPDISAQGVSVPVQFMESTFARANGTSFSCPLISGMCACLIQAFPKATAPDIISALQHSADRFNDPDSLYGYGIPDVNKAALLLLSEYPPSPDREFLCYPNPVNGKFSIWFAEPPGSIELNVYNISGMLVLKRSYPDFTEKVLENEDLANLGQGLYILKIKTSGRIFSAKLSLIKD
ncbi:MAG: S8 family serine peptidase [Bacteroidales bacterium]